MSLNDRADQALAKWKAGYITHGLQLEMVDLVREYRAQSVGAEPAPLAIDVPAKAEPTTVDHDDHEEAP